MHSCPECGSNELNKRGTKYRKKRDTYEQQYKCTNCGNRFNSEIPKIDDIIDTKADTVSKYIITSYQKNTKLNKSFLLSLTNYANENGADIYILTGEISDDDVQFDAELKFLYESYNVVSNNFYLGNHINVYSELKISKTAENPLAGIDGLSKGKSLIIGHPVLQMKVLPVFGNAHPIMLTTTGSISLADYDTSRKSGAKANHNHSSSALIVELDEASDIFHIRVLNANDDGTFNDLDYHYDGYNKTKESVEAVIFGDTHVSVACDDVVEATFGTGGLLDELRPSTIIHHDLLDFGVLQSHHNKNSFIKRYQKYVEGKDSIVAELNTTVSFLATNTPDYVDNVLIISSNHNDHLTQYLDTYDIKHDYKNAKIYYYLMYKLLNDIEAGIDANPFKIYFEEVCKDKNLLNKIKFLGREQLYYIKDILVSSHGDRGDSGSRFSPTQGKKYPSKMIVGHSHSPSINAGCYITGTMTGKLDYTIGTPSAWMNTHCIIHKSGKRQLVSIVNGKYKLD